MNHYRTPSGYSRWDLDHLVERFAAKGPSDFFETEIHFLERVGPELKHVLDVGCASGRLVEVLRSINGSVGYTGIDIAAKNIASAEALYPDLRFWLGNVIDYDANEAYDLVNATGVVQHEANYAGLIDSMFRLTDRFVLFDAKVSGSGASCVDPNLSYAGPPDARVPFNVFSLGWLLDHMLSNYPLSSLDIFGYQTPLNEVTTVPAMIGPVYSVGVFCSLAETRDAPAPLINIEIDGPR